MRIGIDALGIERASGGRTATLNLLKPLFQIDHDNQYCVSVSTYEPGLDVPGANVEQWVLPVQNRFIKRIYAQMAFPIKMRGYDVVHFTKNLSLWGPLPPQILTIYDLSMLKFPELMAKSDLLYWRSMQRWSVRSANQIITLSNSAAKDIEQFYHIPSNKIRVIYPACSPQFIPATQNEIEYVREKYHLPHDYILHVGRIDRLKNLPVLVKVFDRLRKSGVYSGKLVLVGAVYKKTPDLDLIPTIQQLGLEKDVILTGYIADEDLPAIFSGACLKVFASHNEGFGLVALEAMACGTPVVAYRAGGAVAEVVGEAGIVTESNDVDTLTEAVGRVVSNRELRTEMKKKGLAQALKFNRFETARQTLAVYHAVAGK